MSDFSRNGDYKNGESNGRNGARTIRFGSFEADLLAGEVRKSGNRVRLQEQPFKVLQVLLEHPGALVTREELQARIWPEETFGDFDHAVNVAVGKLRMALGDSADNPSFIETVPRRGYRFIAPLEGAPAVPPPLAKTDPPPVAASSFPRKAFLAVLILALSGALLGLGIFLGRRNAGWHPPEFQRLTVRHGTVYSARFTPDGHNVIYSTSLGGAPIEMFSSDLNFSGVRSLGIPATSLLAISSMGEMAVLQTAAPRFMLTVQGTLGQVPLTGGSPRQIAENAEWADWSPDGKSLAIVRDMVGKERLEYPVGHVLYETIGWISHMRISPKGDRIAFLDHLSLDDDQGVVSVVDLAGHRRVLSTGWESEEGLAWSPKGNEVWFSATQAGLDRRIYAVDLSGNERLAFRAPGGVTLQDIAPDGRVLLTSDEQRAGIVALAPGATRERDLSWLDWSLPASLSPDGNRLLLDEEGEQGGPNYTVAMRDTNGSAPIPLGEGMAGDLSPDGKWAATVIPYSQIMLLPTGPGAVRKIERGGIERYGHQVHWLPDGKQIVFSGNQVGHESRCFLQAIDGGKPRPVTPEGISFCQVSPDGRLIAGSNSEDHEAQLYPVDGGAPRPIPGLLPGESVAWTSDPRFLYTYKWKQPTAKIFRLNIENGQKQFFREISPEGLSSCLTHVLLSADGQSYVYGYTSLLSDLYLVKGLK